MKKEKERIKQIELEKAKLKEELKKSDNKKLDKKSDEDLIKKARKKSE